MGESISGQEMFDQDIMPFISSCNVSCGYHSGNQLIIERTIRTAIDHSLKIGAHPSYNDAKNYGRKSLDTPLPTLLAELRYQICAIKGMVESMGGRLNHVKPHGALYNDAAMNAELAILISQLVKEIDPSLKIYGLSNSAMKGACDSEGIKFVAEAFADRRYQDQTQLRNRELKGSLLHKEAEVLSQVRLLISNKVQLYDGTLAEIEVDTICLHSDTPSARKLARSIHDLITQEKIKIG